MKRFVLGIAALALVSGASAADLRSQFLSLNAQVTAAIMKRDIQAFVHAVRPMVTKDFKYREAGHTFTFDQMVGQMRASFQQMSKVTAAHSNLVFFNEKGDSGVCKANETMSGVMLDPGKKKTHTMSYSGVAVYDFKKVNGQWRMSSMTATTTSMTMDGKPIKM